mgnify:CR=1 FL=1
MGDTVCLDDHAIIGNMQTAALISRKDASVEFMCYPHFDSPSLFCRILDSSKGHFAIHPASVGNVKQFYYPLSNVLVTRFSDDQGIGQVIDLMPISSSVNKSPVLVRKVEVLRGEMEFSVQFIPKPEYGQSNTSSLNLKVAKSDKGIVVDEKQEAVLIRQSESVIYYLAETEDTTCYDFEGLQAMIEGTNEFWRRWVSKCTYKGRWREMVLRSALVLKLLTFAPTGAIIAAPTFSLPARTGYDENWDYRFAWIRDSAFTLYAFIRIGLIDEARAYMKWIEKILNESNDNEDAGIKVMYGIHLRNKICYDEILDERVLEDFQGFQGSRPVRIGNAAVHQSQLDIYGELMDSIYLCDKYFSQISFDLWNRIKAEIVKPVMNGWKDPDHGIWEVRGPPRHHVYSKVMCWVAIDRAIRMAIKHSLPAPLEEWRLIRDEIRDNIMTYGWNDELQSFTQYYGSKNLDAANLIMPLVFFIAPNDPKMVKTIEATLKSPVNNGLTVNNMVYRFETEQQSKKEGTFTMCSFWLSEAMARASVNYDDNLLKKSRDMFEQLLGYANHVGLYSEGLDITGKATGNFPQAFTHFSLISAAYCLDRILG